MADSRNPDCTCEYLNQTCLACWKGAKHENPRGCKHCPREYLKLKNIKPDLTMPVIRRGWRFPRGYKF